jgi:YD repeat-containing protein
VDEFKIRSWNTNTSAFDVVEHADNFGIDGSGNVTDTPVHDAAGNLTYDGSQKYTYDGWNRMKAVAHAYRDGAGSLQTGQTSATISYDGKGRRVKKAVSGTGQWDITYQYLYDADSVVETRNGSGMPIQQYVWGTRYVDELVQVATETDDASTSITGNDDTVLWACQDANYNVLGVVDADGVLVERYQYTPYGQRLTFFSPGSNDVGGHASTVASRRANLVGTLMPYGLCEAGHQGLLHDEDSGLVYNRARMLHMGLGRFAQRDPLRNPSPIDELPDAVVWQILDSLNNADSAKTPWPKEVAVMPSLKTIAERKARSIVASFLTRGPDRLSLTIGNALVEYHSTMPVTRTDPTGYLPYNHCLSCECSIIPVGFSCCVSGNTASTTPSYGSTLMEIAFSACVSAQKVVFYAACVQNNPLQSVAACKGLEQCYEQLY